MKDIFRSIGVAMEHSPVLTTCLIVVFSVLGVGFGLITAAQYGLMFQRKF